MFSESTSETVTSPIKANKKLSSAQVATAPTLPVTMSAYNVSIASYDVIHATLSTKKALS